MSAGMLVWLVLIVACVLMLIRLDMRGKRLTALLAQAEQVATELVAQRERVVKAMDAIAIYRAQLVASTTADDIFTATNTLIEELRQARP